LRVVEEIISRGKKCNAVQLNILNSDKKQWQLVHENGSYDVAFYFATPHIELNTWRSWSKDLFDRYCQYYLDNFQITVHLLLKHASKDCNKLVVVQPSTIFVEKPEQGTAEYAAAKAAMESMSLHLEAEHTSLSVITPRLARLRTDQTGALDSKQVDPALPAMIELVNECFLRLRGK
jgi:NAD(P)-dependent dehydrogenase (short-subunit alcohol dehydrogenase family)